MVDCRHNAFPISECDTAPERPAKVSSFGTQLGEFVTPGWDLAMPAPAGARSGVETVDHRLELEDFERAVRPVVLPTDDAPGGLAILGPGWPHIFAKLNEW